jgi:hypothetical protein
LDHLVNFDEKRPELSIITIEQIKSILVQQLASQKQDLLEMFAWNYLDLFQRNEFDGQF